jgi:hypothetical protein
MLDETLKSFVGHQIELSPAVGRDATSDATDALERGHRTSITAVVVGLTEQWQLRIDTDDLNVLRLGDRAVYAQPISSATLFRIQGMLEVLTHHPLPAECLLTPFDHDGILERRQWLRIPTVLPVRVEMRGTGQDCAMVIETTSIDLSGGGLKIRNGPPCKDGSRVALVIELPGCPIDVEAEVLETMPGGMARLRFVRMTESAYRRVVRHLFDVQREARMRRPVEYS